MFNPSYLDSVLIISFQAAMDATLISISVADITLAGFLCILLMKSRAGGHRYVPYLYFPLDYIRKRNTKRSSGALLAQTQS